MVSENNMAVTEVERECSVLSLCITERQAGLTGADVGPINKEKLGVSQDILTGNVNGSNMKL